MKKEELFERIENMSPEELSRLFCEALDESDIPYETGVSRIAFVKLEPLRDMFYFSFQNYTPKTGGYSYEQRNTVLPAIIGTSNFQNYNVEKNVGAA